jgi:hypothetical protein
MISLEDQVAVVSIAVMLREKLRCLALATLAHVRNERDLIAALALAEAVPLAEAEGV